MEYYANTDQRAIYRNPNSFFRYCGWPSVCHDGEGESVCGMFRIPRRTCLPVRQNSAVQKQ